MPLYEYECGACGHRFEIIQKFSDGPPEACPKCGKGPLQRLQSSPAFQFKGTGWYVTDYAGRARAGRGERQGRQAGGEERFERRHQRERRESKKSEGESKKSDAPASTTAAKE
jgi:putative FmdB family regulatory protein